MGGGVVKTRSGCRVASHFEGGPMGVSSIIKVSKPSNEFFQVSSPYLCTICKSWKHERFLFDVI